MDIDEPTRNRLALIGSLEVGGSPTDTQVTLCIYADDLEPDRVSALVGCAPTAARRRGESYPDRPKVKPATIGQWLLEAPNALPFNEKIQFLIDATCKDETAWRKLQETHRLELRTAIFLRSWTEGIALPSSAMAEIALRRWSFSLSMYSADGEEILDAFLGRAGMETESNGTGDSG